MRKLFSLILAVTLIFLLAACSMTNDNSGGLADDLKDGADNLMEDTGDMAGDLKDDITASPDAPAKMPEDSIDGTMENTEENVSPDTAQ